MKWFRKKSTIKNKCTAFLLYVMVHWSLTNCTFFFLVLLRRLTHSTPWTSKPRNQVKPSKVQGPAGYRVQAQQGPGCAVRCASRESYIHNSITLPRPDPAPRSHPAIQPLQAAAAAALPITHRCRCAAPAAAGPAAVPTCGEMRAWCCCCSCWLCCGAHHAARCGHGAAGPAAVPTMRRDAGMVLLQLLALLQCPPCGEMRAWCCCSRWPCCGAHHEARCGHAAVGVGSGCQCRQLGSTSSILA